MSPHPPCSGPTGSTGPPDRGLEGQADGKTIFPGMWVSMGGPHRHTCPCTLQAHTSHNAPRDQTLPGRFLPKGLGKAEGKGIGRTHAGSLDCSRVRTEPSLPGSPAVTAPSGDWSHSSPRKKTLPTSQAKGLFGDHPPTHHHASPV